VLGDSEFLRTIQIFNMPHALPRLTPWPDPAGWEYLCRVLFCSTAQHAFYPFARFIASLDCNVLLRILAGGQLLRGHFAAAFHFNAHCLLLPFLGWFGLRFIAQRKSP
jgi:hypothetical protein